MKGNILNSNIVIKSMMTIALLITAARATATEKLFIPTHPQPKAGLFVVLHGCLTNAQDIEVATRFSEHAETQGFYVFYPEPAKTNTKGCFEFYTPEAQKPGGGDAAIVVSKVQEILNTYDIDPNKVFVAGMSAGSSLIPNLVNCYPEVFKGAAMHSGMGYGLTSTWQESLTVAVKGPNKRKQRNNFCDGSNYKGKVFLIHGTGDKVMNPKHFKLLNKDYFTGLESKAERFPAANDVYSYTRRHFYYGNEVVGQSLLVDGMAHDWSGSKPMIPICSQFGPQVTPLIIDFFLYNN